MSTFELNGNQVTVSGDHPHLLAALRDELGILSAKDGCSPTGQCGCCTVIMDGKARISCQLTPERANGSTIQTLEGLDSKEIDEMGASVCCLWRSPMRLLHARNHDSHQGSR